MNLKRILAWLLVGALLVLAAGLGLRSYRSLGGPPLQAWHTHVPTELSASALDSADWTGYLAQEQVIFDDIRANVTRRLETDARVPYNRYFEGSPVYPPRFAQDWNRSYVMEPAGPPQGVVVLLHGLTDSPYSLRHVARRYAERGFVAIGVRMPGHGTVPAGLTDVRWEAWSAATRLAVREARRRAPSPAAAAPGRVLQRRRAGSEVRARRDRGPEAGACRPARALYADDRDHALCALRRTGRPARSAAAICQCRVAQQPAGIQPLQVQLVPGQRRAPVLTG